jgi:hypothetical protein
MISVKTKDSPTAAGPFRLLTADMHITFGFLHAVVPRDHRPARRLESEPFFVKRDPKGVCDEGVVESLCVMSETGAPQGLASEERRDSLPICRTAQSLQQIEFCYS